LTFRNGPYSYEIARQGNRPVYTVSNGDTAISEPIIYCFGLGSVGQTYLFQHNGSLYESRVSYYRTIQKLDFTGGHLHLPPGSLDEALGRRVGAGEALECFGCHAPNSVSGSELRLDHLTPGITCESCHGPGERHIVAVKAGKLKDLQIFNPGKIGPNELSQEFCGSCYRSFDQAMVLPRQGGLNNLRFQPYRIFNSRGHNEPDSRISCIACHDPHQQIVREPAFYDARCLACHLSSVAETRTAKRAGPACPVAKQQCVICHMPKVEVPEMHYKFTDHWIRIAKPGDPVPN